MLKRSSEWLLPVLGVLFFVVIWHFSALQVKTSLGSLPGPVQTAEQFVLLVEDHLQEGEKEQAFYERQEVRNAKKLAADPDANIKVRAYTGKATFFDQIVTSLVTVACGFILASVIAIPLGLVLGLNHKLYMAFNPIIQLLKPVSPLAWLPLVTMVVSASYVTKDPLVAKSFLNSMLTVTLCSLWPTLINTAVGVTNVDKDLVNVSRVLRLSYWQHIRTIVLPSAIPMIFTGLRLSIGIAWMVLIAAEMLAQNPGLGKFVWDEFQNGSAASLSRIMVAVVMIGFIGLMLDRLMLMIQKRVSWDKQQVLR
ncbi:MULTISPECIES: ABC transporter permease [unclassified Photobacterium]|uniref:ABC transporter permease n=1 Tax=unclassified Photobacterium TaxID=2628852 RepID=UPI000D17AAC9|nr:nitrate ABC transporter permease [Photobacterium sp. GB-56]PSV30162.1 nitrate ABC transporter permease [Photobacterium sp. GB-72]PSV34044.1 nitrate ABC transporter permease [Photobacterium sp. GB-27]PSV38172.1 nitrate ABC transporter permease [Photobacterium sp. GB-210]PSV54305.1 nitrate ABC transporter permease [Photobacterium sp. GB-1]PSV55788.1 nitrate ABC transporter permease [Photobacterium sp. GB-3]PSW71937.1 nitrate ABC transporter permease [Photobacterium sp. GB-50]